MKVIATTRLDLVPVMPWSARNLWRILQQPNLREFQDIPRLPLQEFERQVRLRPHVLEPNVSGRFEWLIREREGSRDVGWLSLRINERGLDTGELGYSLLVEARGKGYATEALRALVDQAFASSSLNELHACTIPENYDSRAVLRRVGFEEARMLHGGALVRNKRVDIVLFIHTRAQYLARLRERMVG